MPSSFLRSRSMRRTATVIISASAASIARRMMSLVAYLPVPRIRRDRNSLPAMTKGLSVTSASAHEVHELEGVARAHLGRGELLSVQNHAIIFDDDQLRMQLEVAQQIDDRTARCDVTLLAVDGHADQSIGFHCIQLSSASPSCSAAFT